MHIADIWTLLELLQVFIGLFVIGYFLYLISNNEYEK